MFGNRVGFVVEACGEIAHLLQFATRENLRHEKPAVRIKGVSLFRCEFRHGESIGVARRQLASFRW